MVTFMYIHYFSIVNYIAKHLIVSNIFNELLISAFWSLHWYFLFQHTSFEQLVVKVFNKDQSSKTMMIDERMTTRNIVNQLLDKNHFDFQPDWTLMEEIPSLYMGESIAFVRAMLLFVFLLVVAFLMTVVIEFQKFKVCLLYLSILYFFCT